MKWLHLCSLVVRLAGPSFLVVDQADGQANQLLDLRSLGSTHQLPVAIKHGMSRQDLNYWPRVSHHMAASSQLLAIRWVVPSVTSKPRPPLRSRPPLKVVIRTGSQVPVAIARHK